MMHSSTHAHIALTHIQVWICGEGVGTYSARILSETLLSLAGKREVRLSSLQALDNTRRTWIAEVVFGLHHLTNTELLAAAGEDGESVEAL